MHPAFNSPSFFLCTSLCLMAGIAQRLPVVDLVSAAFVYRQSVIDFEFLGGTTVNAVPVVAGHYGLSLLIEKVIALATAIRLATRKASAPQGTVMNLIALWQEHLSTMFTGFNHSCAAAGTCASAATEALIRTRRFLDSKVFVTILAGLHYVVFARNRTGRNAVATTVLLTALTRFLDGKGLTARCTRFCIGIDMWLASITRIAAIDAISVFVLELLTASAACVCVVGHSVSLSLNLNVVLAGGEINRLSGATLANTISIAQKGGLR